MDDSTERRRKARFDHESPLTLEGPEIGRLNRARMYNYSSRGIYFESDRLLEPGTRLYVGVRQPPEDEPQETYACRPAVVKWRRYLEESAFDYGYGLQLLDAEPQPPPGQDNEARRHPRRRCSIPAVAVAAETAFEVLIRNVSRSGIFFKADQRLFAGQTLEVRIPLRDSGKLLRRRAKVVWCAEGGVGVRLEPEGGAGNPTKKM